VVELNADAGDEDEVNDSIVSSLSNSESEDSDDGDNTYNIISESSRKLIIGLRRQMADIMLHILMLVNDEDFIDTLDRNDSVMKKSFSKNV
jgi:hypothetical protein